MNFANNCSSCDVVYDLDFPLTGHHAGSSGLRIGIVLWPAFPLLALAGLLDTLRHAADTGDNGGRPCCWRIMSDRPDDLIISSSGIGVKADCGYSDPKHFDYITVIGGLLPDLDKGSRAARGYLHAAARAGVTLAGICTGSFILAEEGMLEGRRAVVHPYHLQAFRDRFPGVHSISGCDYIDHGEIVTCPGGIATISLATELIRRHCGPERATHAIHQIAFPVKAAGAAPGVSRAHDFNRIADRRLRKAVFLVEQCLVKSVSTEWLAQQVNLSSRQLTRLFKSEFNKTPGEFIRASRLRYGKWLLRNSADSVTDIALRTGFSDCGHFIRCFQQEYGCTPGRYRASATVNGPPTEEYFANGK